MQSQRSVARSGSPPTHRSHPPVLVSIVVRILERSDSIAIELRIQKLTVDVEYPGSFCAVTGAAGERPTNQYFLQARHGGR